MTMASTDTTNPSTNPTTAPAKTDDSPVSLTEVAAAKVHEIAKAKRASMARACVCRSRAAVARAFSTTSTSTRSPRTWTRSWSRGIQLFVDPLSAQYLEGTEIDYVEGLSGAGFKFGNPNVKGTCGCGSSFSV
jgi:iron-sulfur cluster insertion protein